MDNNELQHHGIQGQRWGVRRTAAQLGNASSGKNKKSFFKKNQGTEQKKETPEETAAKKSEILKSRSAKKIYENADLFTDAELQTAYNRLQLERNIAGLAPKEVKKGEQFVDATIKWGRKVNDVSDTGIKMYNNIAKLRNTFSENGRSNPWPVVGGENKKKPTVASKMSSMMNNQAKKQTATKTSAEKPASEKTTENQSPEKTTREKTSGGEKTRSTERTNTKTERTRTERTKTENKSSREPEREVWEGTVEPTEKRKRNTNWRNVRTSHLLTDRNVNTGRNYVTNLLEDKRK